MNAETRQTSTTPLSYDDVFTVFSCKERGQEAWRDTYRA